MFDITQVKAKMPVVCSNDVQFATVDHIDGDELKLARDKDGKHHFIPIAWIQAVDDKVHIDRPGKEAMAHWRTAA